MRLTVGVGFILSLTIHAVLIALVTLVWQQSPQIFSAYAVEIVSIKDFALEAQAPLEAEIKSKHLSLPRQSETAPISKAEPVTHFVSPRKNASTPAKPVKEQVQVNPISSESSARSLSPSPHKSTASTGGTPGLPAGESDKLAAARVGALRASYEQAVAARLERAKRYPRPALLRNLEGNVVLYLEIGRDGSVLESSIRETSGFKFFDGEVIEMVERVGRFPRLPQEIPAKSIAYLVPVSFQLTN